MFPQACPDDAKENAEARRSAAACSLALRFAALPVDIQDALADVGEEMIRARAKFPGTKHLTAALMEEVGEVAKELLEDGDNVWGECVQTACVALRIATEGDADFDQAKVSTKAGCAACDRGDYQLGHAEGCPANAPGMSAHQSSPNDPEAPPRSLPAGAGFGFCRVVSAIRRSGTRGNGTAWKEWDITLECGRSTDQAVRHKPGGNKGWGALWHARPLSDELPAPKRLRCNCGQNDALTRPDQPPRGDSPPET